MNFSNLHLSDLRNNQETSRVGNKWLAEEDAKLIDEINDKKSFQEIALEHKRTITGIKSRIISHIIYPQYKNDKSIDDLSSQYNIEKELIEKYINKIKTNNVILQSIKQNHSGNKECIESNKSLLFVKISSLENKMITIEQKLDYLINIISK